MGQLTTSIIQKVKDELSVTEDISTTELYDLLHKYRSSQHPDRFTDDELKRQAEEKFKKLNTLLSDLSRLIEQEELQKKPSELIPFQKDLEIVKVKQENVRYEEEISNLKLTVQIRDSQVAELRDELAKARSEKVDEKTKELVKLYKPSRRSLFSLGLTFFLTFIIGTLSKVDEIAQIIAKYLPFNEQVFNTIIFAVLIFIPVKYLKMIYEQGKIEDFSKIIKTPLFINGFMKYLENQGITDLFNEMNVYDYIATQLTPKNKILSFIFSKVVHLYTPTTIDSLKDIFIYNLLNKQLIEISSAERLDRQFRIIKKTRYPFSISDLPF